MSTTCTGSSAPNVCEKVEEEKRQRSRSHSFTAGAQPA